MTWKYAENLACKTFRSSKVKTWAQFFGISVGMCAGNRETHWYWPNEKLSIGSSWDLKIRIKNTPGLASRWQGAMRQLLNQRLRETVQGLKCALDTSARHAHYARRAGEMPSNIYSGGIIQSQSCTVCSHKTKKILKNVLHILLRGDKL